MRQEIVPRARRDEIRLWRDAALGSGGVDLLAGRCFEHRYRPHFHDEFVIATFVAGAQVHKVGRYRGVALPGNVLIIPAGEVHTGQAAVGGDGWRYRAFYPDEATLSAIAEDVFADRRAYRLDIGTTPLHQDPAVSRRLAAPFQHSGIRSLEFT